MKLGICIYDNDFNQAIKAFLGLFRDSYMGCYYKEHLTRANVIRAWNLSIVGIYFISQHHFLDEFTAKEEDHLRKYLTTELKDDSIFLNDECLQKITEDNNWEFSYIDLDTGEIYSS